MKRIAILGVALVMALLPLSSARAADMDAEAIEKIVTDLESVIGRIEGIDFAKLNVRSHRNGLYQVAIPIPEATRERLLAKSGSAADFKPLATGLQLSNPNSFSTLISALDCNPNTDYNHWFVVANLRSTDQIKRTTFQAKGPRSFKVIDTLVYDAEAFNLFFIEEPTGGFGFRTIQVKVVGGGKAKMIALCN